MLRQNAEKMMHIPLKVQVCDATEVEVKGKARFMKNKNRRN